MAEITYRLDSESLLSKWGFDDGDPFSDWLLGPTNHAFRSKIFLAAVVRKFLIPKLDQKVEIVFLDTCHNPIRAAKVDGVAVDWYSSNPGIKLTPEFVEVTDEQLAQTLAWLEDAGSSDAPVAAVEPR